MANRLVITMNAFVYIISFQLLEPMQLLVTCLLGIFVFQEIDEIIYIYTETREKIDELFQSVYAENVSLANEFVIKEK